MNELFSNIEPWHFYFGIAVVLLALEMLTGTFDLLWLGLAALGGALVAWLLPENTWLPMLATALLAVGLSILGWRWKKKGLQGAKGYHDPIDALINKKGKVVEAIGPQHMGIVRVGSETWSAASDEALAVGEQVIITGRSSTVVQVKRA